MSDTITIPAEAWRRVGPASDAAAILRTVIEINGCPMHLEAIATATPDGEQRGATDETDATLDLLSTLTAAGDPWATARIGGRPYVLVAAPFAN